MSVCGTSIESDRMDHVAGEGFVAFRLTRITIAIPEAMRAMPAAW